MNPGGYPRMAGVVKIAERPSRVGGMGEI